MRIIASLGRALLALLPHNHGHLTQPARRTRCYAHPAGAALVTAAELEERLVPEYALRAERRRFAYAETQELPVFTAAVAAEARMALAHNAMRGVDVTWMDRDEAIRTVGIEYVEVAA